MAQFLVLKQMEYSSLASVFMPKVEKHPDPVAENNHKSFAPHHHAWQLGWDICTEDAEFGFHQKWHWAIRPNITQSGLSVGH